MAMTKDVARPAFRAAEASQVDDHRCVVCGAFASFGVGPPGDVRLVRDRAYLIKWFCFKHWPDNPTNQGSVSKGPATP
jgi:hypothetical protein